MITMVLVTACEPLGSYVGLDTPDDTAPPVGVLAATPWAVDFGTVAVHDGPARQTLTLRNTGDDDIVVTGHNQLIGLYGEDARVFTVSADDALTIAPNTWVAVPIVFQPPTDGRWEAMLNLQPGDVRVGIVGRGAAPIVGIDEPPYATAAFTCETTIPVDVFNQGSDYLYVERFTLHDPWGSWSMETDPSPVYLAPGQRLSLPVTFAPEWASDASGTQTAMLSVWTDDPIRPRTDVSLRGLALEVDGVDEHFTYNPFTMVDLLVVADTDGVMELRIPDVQQAVPSLVDSFADAGVSLQTAVVTGVSPCPTVAPAVASPAVERDARIAQLQAGIAGERGPGSDQLGDHTALTMQQAEQGGCLAGLIREDSLLNVLLVAGDEDASSLQPRTQLANIEAVADRATRVHVLLPTDSVGCGGTRFSASYAQLADLSDGALVDLCADDLVGDIRQVVRAALADVAEPLTHTLEHAPIPASIEVKVDGEPWTAWHYDERTNSVQFDAAAPPPAGADMWVHYHTPTGC